MASACPSTAPTATPSHGVGYQKILAHYYTGTDLGQDSGRVRVLLGESGSVEFSGAGKACGKTIEKRSKYTFVAAGGGVELRDSRGKKVALVRGRGQGLERAQDLRLRLVPRRASSRTEDGGDLLVINQLGSEDYVRGVVANESPASWPIDALRAQAVVARTYGLATSRGGVFDQYADTRSQVYGGKDSETKETNQAVADTAKQVVTYKGDLATDLLLLDLRRPDRGLRVRLRRRQRDPVSALGQGPLRRRLPGPQLDRDLLRRRHGDAAARPVPRQAQEDRRRADGHIAADRQGARRRAQPTRQPSPATSCASAWA